MAKKNQAKIKVLVLDVMKPHKPNIAEFGQFLCEQKSVQNANISVYAIDEKTETTKVVLDGQDINLEEVNSAIEDFGAVIHSVDKVVVGSKKLIEAPDIPQQDIRK